MYSVTQTVLGVGEQALLPTITPHPYQDVQKLITKPNELATLAHPALAQFGGWGGGGSGYWGENSGSGYSGYGGSSGGGGDGDGDGDGFGGGENFGAGLFRAGSDFETAMRRRAVHGFVGAVAFVILFPLGAIFLRIIPGRWSMRIHYFIQIVAWLLYIAGFALGIILLRMLPSGIQGLVSFFFFLSFLWTSPLLLLAATQ